MLKSILLVFALPVYGAIHESLSWPPYGWSECPVVVDNDTSISLSVSLYVAYVITYYCQR